MNGLTIVKVDEKDKDRIYQSAYRDKYKKVFQNINIEDIGKTEYAIIDNLFYMLSFYKKYFYKDIENNKFTHERKFITNFIIDIFNILDKIDNYKMSEILKDTHEDYINNNNNSINCHLANIKKNEDADVISNIVLLKHLIKVLYVLFKYKDQCEFIYKFDFTKILEEIIYLRYKNNDKITEIIEINSYSKFTRTPLLKRAIVNIINDCDLEKMDKEELKINPYINILNLYIRHFDAMIHSPDISDEHKEKFIKILYKNLIDKIYTILLNDDLIEFTNKIEWLKDSLFDYNLIFNYCGIETNVSTYIKVIIKLIYNIDKWEDVLSHVYNYDFKTLLDKIYTIIGKMDNNKHILSEIDDNGVEFRIELKTNPIINEDISKDDMLCKLWNAQKSLDDIIFKSKNLTRGQTKKDRLLSLQVELGELLKEDEVYKYWKDNKKTSDNAEQLEKIKEEYVDILHFLLSIGIDYFNSPEEIFEYYMRKNAINIERNKNNY